MLVSKFDGSTFKTACCRRYATTMSQSDPTTTDSIQYYPPGASCFKPDGSGAWNSTLYENNNCSVTPDMIDFLNLTSTISNYIVAYCLNPPDGDSCPFGYCPNSDIAGAFCHIGKLFAIKLLSGPLVRISSESVTTFSAGGADYFQQSLPDRIVYM